jgi:hypothetical protein
MSVTPVKFYDLREYDGGDGRGNMSIGVFTDSHITAESWAKSNLGRDYRTVDVVVISHLSEVVMALEERKKQQALNKLTTEERRLLGL